MTKTISQMEIQQASMILTKHLLTLQILEKTHKILKMLKIQIQTHQLEFNYKDKALCKRYSIRMLTRNCSRNQR